MNDLPKLNLPAVKLRVRQHDGQLSVWDGLRQLYVVLTPEEWVRRHLIGYLTDTCGIPAERIVQEHPVPLNGTPQRADVVVFDRQAHPLLLAECKAPTIRIDSKVLAQAVRYNSVIGARYIVLTNGLQHYCCECRDGEYVQMRSFPAL